MRHVTTNTQIEARRRLALFLVQHPDARIVTDVGASLFSGWGDLIEVEYHPEINAIELVFA